MSEMLKGNFEIPNLDEKIKKVEDGAQSLKEEFEAAALKKLGGSITFVKKPRKSNRHVSFIWRGENDE